MAQPAGTPQEVSAMHLQLSALAGTQAIPILAALRLSLALLRLRAAPRHRLCLRDSPHPRQAATAAIATHPVVTATGAC
jgi:hypothetical protein